MELSTYPETNETTRPVNEAKTIMAAVGYTGVRGSVKLPSQEARDYEPTEYDGA